MRSDEGFKAAAGGDAGRIRMGQLIYLMRDTNGRAAATTPGDARDDQDIDVRRNMARPAIRQTVASVDRLKGSVEQLLKNLDAVDVVIEKLEDAEEQRFLRQAVSASRHALTATEARLSLEIGWLTASLSEKI
jgi:hypothetical protein